MGQQAVRRKPFDDMVWIAGGTFRMGSDDFYPEERPVHPAHVDGFWIDRHPVTNAEFARFVETTDYVTIAERRPNPGEYPDIHPALLVPGSLVFRRPPGRVGLRDVRLWWAYVPGACWKEPEGPGSSLDGRDDHPVVHIAYDDAEAFAAWISKELPREAEWEFAARGGLDGAAFVWGNEFAPEGRLLANTRQGEFPWQNLRTDGYEGTSPVGAFPPNGYGLHDMAGLKLTQIAKGDTAFAAGLLVLLLVVTIVYMPIVVPLIGPAATVSALAIATPLILTMLLPLGIGLLVDAWFEPLTDRLVPIMNKVSSAALIVLVATTVLTNYQSLLSVFGTGAILAALLVIAGAFGAGYLLGGSDPAERGVIGLGTAQRNIAAATVVATQSFDDPMTLVMVVVTSIVSMAVLFPAAKAMGGRRQDDIAMATGRTTASPKAPLV